MKLGLTPNELACIRAALIPFPVVQEAVLFGSRAMGNFKSGSDVDIALKGAGKVPIGDLARVKAILEEESPLPYTFDIVDYAGIETPAFKQHIDTHGVSIYRHR